MTQMESPKRKMQKRNDYQRHKLFRKIKRRRKAQAEADQHIAEKQLRKKLKLPKFGGGKGTKSETGAPLEVKDGMLYYKETGEPFYSAGLLLPEVEIIGDKSKVNPWAAPLENKIYPQLLQFHNSGKDINIKPSKRGTFTKAAKQHGMSVQGFANRVLRNPSKYSAAMRKKANFARNASKWNK